MPDLPDWPLWIVQRYDSHSRSWFDIPRATYGFPDEALPWAAFDAGSAFHSAVTQNEKQRPLTTSYRVLPYEGGATFNLSLNVDGSEHVRSVIQKDEL